MSAHTPGPWVAEISEKSATVFVLGPRGDGNVRSTDGLGELVAVDCGTDDAIMFSPMSDEQIANAHLMACAPELLAALEAIADYRPKPEDCDPSIPDDPYVQMARGCKAIARAALAKAQPLTKGEG